MDIAISMGMDCIILFMINLLIIIPPNNYKSKLISVYFCSFLFNYSIKYSFDRSSNMVIGTNLASSIPPNLLFIATIDFG